MQLDSKTQTYQELMGNGRLYEVPRFQRDYAWDTDDWEELWQDMVQLSDQNGHYMGYVVLQPSEDNRRLHRIIDGQQRLTTLAIITLAVLKHFKKLCAKGQDVEENTNRIETLEKEYIGARNIISASIDPKLTLNRNNKLYFKKMCSLSDGLPLRGIKTSERLLGKALKYYEGKIEQYALNDSARLSTFFNTIINNLYFTTITVGDDINAYKVFETLNARGVKLSTPDLLKNLLFSIVDKQNDTHASDLDDLDDQWDEICKQIGKNDLNRYVFSHWNSRTRPFTQKNDLFKKIKESLKTPQDAFDYLNSVSRMSGVYAALQDSNDPFWRENGYEKAIPSLNLLEEFSIVQPHAVLLSAFNKFSAEEFCKISGYIETVSVRCTIIGRILSNKLESLYNELAYKIDSNEFKNLFSIKKFIVEKMYIDDKQFEQDFSHRHMATDQSDKKVRLLILEIERHLQNGCSFQNDGNISIEHVLPKNSDEHWGQYFGENTRDYATLLGNMALLSVKDNKKYARQPFEQKKETFQQSPFITTRWIANRSRWDANAILERQQYLASLAVQRWRIELH